MSATIILPQPRPRSPSTSTSREHATGADREGFCIGSPRSEKRSARDQPRQLGLRCAGSSGGDAVLRPPGHRGRAVRASLPRRKAWYQAYGVAPDGLRFREHVPTSWPITPRRRSTSRTASRSGGRSSRVPQPGRLGPRPACKSPRERVLRPGDGEHYTPSIIDLGGATGRPSPSPSTPIARRRFAARSGSVLGLHPDLAPYKVAVLPLLKKRPKIVENCHRSRTT